MFDLHPFETEYRYRVITGLQRRITQDQIWFIFSTYVVNECDGLWHNPKLTGLQI